MHDILKTCPYYRKKEGVAHIILNFPTDLAWTIGEIKLIIYVKKQLKLMSSLHIFKILGLKKPHIIENMQMIWI